MCLSPAKIKYLRVFPQQKVKFDLDRENKIIIRPVTD